MASAPQAPSPAPAFQPLFAEREDDDLSGHRHRLLIGILGLLLPFLLWIIAGLRLTKGLTPWKILDSISAYYYTGAVAAFVGVLVALAVFFFSYKGYRNKNRWLDKLTAIIAGVAAIGVAFFPTGPPDGLPKPTWWSDYIGKIHYSSAVILFVSFIFFSLFLFPKTRKEKDKSLPGDKRTRNSIYLVCGLGMSACVLLAGYFKLTHSGDIFWPEAIALELFAISWLVKGRADWTALNFGRRAVFYSTNPAQFITMIQSAIKY